MMALARLQLLLAHAPASVRELPVRALDLSTSSQNRLMRAKIKCVGDLVLRSEEDLTSSPDLGEELMAHACRALRELLIADTGGVVGTIALFPRGGTPSIRSLVASASAKTRNLRIESLGLSLRASGALGGVGIRTFGQLADYSDAELLRARGFGRKGLEEVRSLASDLLISDRLDGRIFAEDVEAKSELVLSGSVLGPGMAEQHGSVLLSHLKVSRRAQTRLVAAGVKTVADLAGFTESDLLRLKGFGMTTLVDLRRVLADLAASQHVERPVLETQLQNGASAWESLGYRATIDTFVAGLHDRDKEVLNRRLGLGCEAQTLEEVGASLGVTRERIRQLQKRALRHLAEDTGLKERLGSVLSHLLEGRREPLYIVTLPIEHAWFEGPKLEASIDALVDHWFPDQFHTFRLNGQRIVARIDEDEWQKRKQQARAFVETAVPLRLQRAAVRLAIDAIAGSDALELADDLWSIATENAHFADSAASDSEAILVAYGRSVESRVLWVLESADVPLHFTEISQRILDRFGETDDRQVHNAARNVGYLLARGSYGVWRHTGLSEAEGAYISSLCEQVVEEFGPSRQWHSSEFLDRLAPSEPILEGITHFGLTATLRRFSALHYVGRHSWAQREVGRGGSHARLDIRNAVESVLDEEGAPLLAAEIFRRVQAIRGMGEYFQIHPKGRLVRVGPSLWGLADRDLDVTMEEMGALLDALHETLTARGKALHVGELAGSLKSAVNGWQIYGCAQVDERFKTGSEMVFLSTWDGPRRENISDALRSAFSALKPVEMTTEKVRNHLEGRLERTLSNDSVRFALRACGAVFDKETGVWVSARTDTNGSFDSADDDA